MKKKVIFIAISFFFIINCYCQSTGISKYYLSLYSPSRNITGELYVKDSIGNLFTGTMNIDNSVRKIYGWYVYKISEGVNYSYNTTSMVFYVQIATGFQHQQLFKGVFSKDKKFLSGEYFYYGNEYPFNATLDNEIKTAPELEKVK